MATAPDAPAGPLPPRLVFLFHGVVINRLFMLPLASHLRRRGFKVVNRSYPTTRRTIEEHAGEATRMVEEETRPLRERGTAYEVNFVTHSMGGLVVRYLLTHYPLERVRRFVMLVPPNNGSRKARRFARIPLYRLIYGPAAGAQLASEPPGIFAECGIPQGVEMGIIAGTGGSLISVPTRALEGEHDGVLAVEETALPGVPLKKVPYGHTTILFRRGAWEEVAHFLEHGRFRPEAPDRSASSSGRPGA